MTVALRVFQPNLTTFIAELDQAYQVAWLDESQDVGAGELTIPHDSPVVVANPSVLVPGSLIVVRVDGVDRFGWMVERRRRVRGDVWDPITVVGRGLLSITETAVTYPFGGLVAPPTDRRVFAWMGHDYVHNGWGSPTSLGQYRAPTDSSLAPDPGDPPINEVQRIRLGYDGPTATLSDTWTLTFDGRTTAPIPGAADASQIKSALEALPNIDGVSVTGSDPWDVEFTGSNVAGRKLPLMSMTHTQLRHTHYSWHVRRETTGTAAVEGEEIIEGWPDARAEWFGAFGKLHHWTRVLDVTQSPAAAGPARLFVASLGTFDVWFDGEHIGSGEPYDMNEWDVVLTEFTHKVGIRSDGPTVMTLVRDEGDELGSVLYRSFTPAVFGSSGSPEPWLEWNDDEPPGVTDGYLLGVLFDDAKDRGALAPLTRTWTDTHDSGGKAWDDDLELGLAVGDDSLLDAIQRLADRDVFARLGPDLALHAYRDYAVDLAASVTVPLDDAHELSVESDDDRRDAFLVRYEDGWLDRHEPAFAFRREGFLSLGQVPTPSVAWGLAGRLLDRFLSSALVSPFRTDEAQSTPHPYDDYAPGDLVTAPALPESLVGEWTLAPVKVDAVSGTVDVVGEVAWLTEVTPP